MHIQYVGVETSVSSRTYAFHVLDPPRESREFTVRVLARDFGPGRLRFQDGPSISSERLHRELEVETQESRAEPQLHVSDQDVFTYRADHYPPPKPRARS